ncbi:MAG: DUF1559 domain-containing protein [Planctomycetes bacterium]|nr:DUF1559 domain-containing protein [Planctomycetota bacterium]MBL7039787.1 DUF1559 domain-containing protein [Pirellulaceae bacterium]
MRRILARRAFTLVELLVVITIIGILIALLLPALQAAREAARRTECSNNLKNIALALQGYHNNYEMMPMGAMHSGGNPAGATNYMRGPVLGPSWWYAILPFVERRSLYDDIAQGTRPGYYLDLNSLNGSLANFNARNINQNLPGRPLDKFAPQFMRCPTSPLPKMENQTGTILMPSYVGIAGGTDIAWDTYPGPWLYLQRWGIPTFTLTDTTYRNRYFCRTRDAGILTESGMLPPCKHVSIALCSDGTSNTMIVGEQSGWLRDVDTTRSVKYHGDPGWNRDPTANRDFWADLRGGWLSGTNEYLTVEQRHLNALPSVPEWTANLFNVTTVRYKPNVKDVLGAGGADGAPGCSEVHEAGRGINNPLQSAHRDGIAVAFVDGSVHFIADTTDLGILLRLAIRDDGLDVEME